MSSGIRRKSILILDDDPAFRALVRQILQTSGFQIVEARSARDGLYSAQIHEIVLAIVDYRLPESDGITFISQLRAMGNTAPVVFVSGSWCDAKMFNMLRNILHVSLVLQKPIDPMLFKQQMEGLMPVQRPAYVPSAQPSQDPNDSHVKLTKQEYQKLLLAQTGRHVLQMQTGGNDVVQDDTAAAAQYQTDAAQASGTNDRPGSYVQQGDYDQQGDFVYQPGSTGQPGPAPVVQTYQGQGQAQSEQVIASQPGAHAFVMHGAGDSFTPYGQGDTGIYRPISDDPRSRAEELKRVEFANKVRQAQSELRKSIPPEWEKLSLLVAKVQANPMDGKSRSDALSQAHKLRGTAGSLGLEQTGMCAGRIEDYLTMLDPTDSTEHEILWSEIFRSLADGQVGLGQCEPAAEPGKRVFNLGKILVFADQVTFEPTVQALDPQILATFVRTDKPIEIVMKASSEKYQAAIIDLSLGGKRQAFSIAKQIRNAGGNESLPVIFILPPGESLSAAEITYSGAVAFVESPLSTGALEEALKLLVGERAEGQPLIMTVDDDPVLTSFITSILGERGMRISSLNEPINILEELDKVEPDLVLLDVIMPGLSGYDVCRMLRGNSRWKNLPIIFLTSKSDVEGRESAFKAGGDDFLSKPVLSDELVARIQAQLDRSAIERRKHTLDELTGVLKTEIFLKRCKSDLVSAKEAGRKYSLCLITVNNFSDLAKFGTFAGYQVITALAGLLKVRFRGDILRGRLGEGGLVLAIDGDTKEAVAEALLHMEAEFQLQSFNSDDGQRFDVKLSTALATFPDDCDSFETMLAHAVNELEEKVLAATGKEYSL